MARGGAAEDEHNAREIENAQRLDKVPQEVWEKILLDHLDENDLFPFALSCRYFRQTQKELVARIRQNGPGRREPRRSLKTNLKRKLEEGKPASAEYLQFCYKEKVSSYVDRHKAGYISRLAAFHGHLPLLKELLASYSDHAITKDAGESSLSQSPLCLLLRLGF